MSSYKRNAEAQKEIEKLMEEKYPDLYLAKLEIWDDEGYCQHTTALKYKEWVKNRIKK